MTLWLTCHHSQGGRFPLITTMAAQPKSQGPCDTGFGSNTAPPYVSNGVSAITTIGEGVYPLKLLYFDFCTVAGLVCKTPSPRLGVGARQFGHRLKFTVKFHVYSSTRDTQRHTTNPMSDPTDLKPRSLLEILPIELSGRIFLLASARDILQLSLVRKPL